MKKTIALAGNPNVGKSTLFNALTGMKQHTGNWPGKTVDCAKGLWKCEEAEYQLVDLPGCYSLLSHSQEEEIARNFICFCRPQAVIAVCDATCLERNLNLVLQIAETKVPALLCVNLLDEAKKKQIKIDLKQLSEELGMPVVGISARNRQGLEQLASKVRELETQNLHSAKTVTYPPVLEAGISRLEHRLAQDYGHINLDLRWLGIRLLEGYENFIPSLKENYGLDLTQNIPFANDLADIAAELRQQGFAQEAIRDAIAESFVLCSEEICGKVLSIQNTQYAESDRRLDRLFTSRATGIPIMLLLLFLIFWITIAGANYPSSLLSDLLFTWEKYLLDAASAAHIPHALYAPLILGIYRVLAWVVSCMLPPMAIFFPLFTLLEDFGYLPRVAFNLDKCFKKCCACGKQALTLCMGFGCNAVGVTGCRIIDSPRERLIAILTNSLVPCNGRFPTILTIISIFLIQGRSGLSASFQSAFALAMVILLGIFMTFLASKLLSKTLLKGLPSSFTLELPPYRCPQFVKVILRSLFDRTLFVLGRAVIVAAPCGLIIWAMANITAGSSTLLVHCVNFFDPLGRFLGLDGTILMAFLLGIPANEIVIPVMLMTYLAAGTLMEIPDLTLMGQILADNGWTWITAVCMILFSLMHWPCGTTCLTIYKETQSVKWTLTAILLPTLMGVSFCAAFSACAHLIF